MKSRSAFTLIELLVVVAIIALLIALLLPSLARAREQAKIVKCGANLKAISVALASYNSQNNDIMPHGGWFTLPGWNAGVNNLPIDPDSGKQYGNALLAWPEALYFEGCVRMDTSHNNAHVSGGHSPCSGLSVFQCPSHAKEFQFDKSNPQGTDDRNEGVQGYGLAWCAASDLVWMDRRNNAWSPTSGMAKVRINLIVYARNLTPGHIMATEGGSVMGAWHNSGFTYPYLPDVGGGVYSRHWRNARRGANYLMAGGSVEFSTEYAHAPSPHDHNSDYWYGLEVQAGKYGHPWTHGVSRR
jgi:prepilin-type N-terminal cleavage/methylation domain-containing protein